MASPGVTVLAREICATGALPACVSGSAIYQIVSELAAVDDTQKAVGKCNQSLRAAKPICTSIAVRQASSIMGLKSAQKQRTSRPESPEFLRNFKNLAQPARWRAPKYPRVLYGISTSSIWPSRRR
jgi:hypothetical protein